MINIFFGGEVMWFDTNWSFFFIKKHVLDDFGNSFKFWKVWLVKSKAPALRGSGNICAEHQGAQRVLKLRDIHWLVELVVNI